jgi:hypothetical protein
MRPVEKAVGIFWDTGRNASNLSTPSTRWREEIRKEEAQKDAYVSRGVERCLRPEEQPEIVRALLEKNLSLEFIQEATGLSKDKILSLR